MNVKGEPLPVEVTAEAVLRKLMRSASEWSDNGQVLPFKPTLECVLGFYAAGVAKGRQEAATTVIAAEMAYKELQDDETQKLEVRDAARLARGTMATIAGQLLRDPASHVSLPDAPTT